MIKVGIGGWNFAPWRGTFYPKGLPQSRELHYASRALTTIEINSTYYSSQKPESFRRWAAETPEGFVFSVKASRFATNRKVLAEAGPSIARFVSSGITELKDKLGPILWQMAPTKSFLAEDFAAFLALLPQKQDGIGLKHAVEVRHPSFCAPEFIELARKYRVAVVIADSDKYPMIADRTASFVYARLQKARADVETGYAPKDVTTWANTAKAWLAGEDPKALPCVAPPQQTKTETVFVYMINGAKERAPAAAQALLAQLG